MNAVVDNAVVLVQILGLVAVVSGFVLSAIRERTRDDGLKGMARY